MENKKVFFVDDKTHTRDVMHRIFTRKGYDVRLAKNAQEALQIVKKETLHVMFLDLNLPDMSGIELCRQIKNDKPKAVVYALAGCPSRLQIADGSKDGFDDCFSKTTNISALFKAVEDGFEKINISKAKQKA